MNLPTEIELFRSDESFFVRYEYDEGESEWFDAKAGVGSPGYAPFVEIYEANFGDGWKTVDLFPDVDWPKYEDEVLGKVFELLGEAK